MLSIKSKYNIFIFLLILVLLTIVTATEPTYASGPWYVSPGGNDSNDCLSPTTPCASINGAIGKSSPGNIIYVASGNYSGIGVEVVLIDRDVEIYGGWTTDFTDDSGLSTIDGGGKRRGVTINAGVTTLFDSFVIKNGDAEAGGGFFNNEGTVSLNDCVVKDSSALREGGGINNYHGTVTINRCNINNNSAGFEGGGIFNKGVLEITNSIVESNTAWDGGSYGSGGGVFNYGTMTLLDSTVNGNDAWWQGGGIVTWGSSSEMTLSNSRVLNNSSGFGGGILNRGNLFLNYTTVENNDGSGITDYGGNATIYNSAIINNSEDGIKHEGTLWLVNSTISGNSVEGSGAGIDNYYGSTVIVRSSTITGNSATQHGSGIVNNITSGIPDGTVSLQNTILAGNQGTDCNGPISSEGFNLFGNTSNCTLTSGSGDLIGVNSRLFPLSGKSGFHPLLPDSPAINAADPDGCKDHLGNILNADQRGIARIGRCDIGSYEFDPTNDPLSYTHLPLITAVEK